MGGITCLCQAFADELRALWRREGREQHAIGNHEGSVTGNSALASEVIAPLPNATTARRPAQNNETGMRPRGFPST